MRRLRPRAAAGLDAWVAAVKRHGPTELRTALSAFRNWRREILAFFDFLPTRLSNGFVEGKNNRTKALMRQGDGYPNRRHLRVRFLLEVPNQFLPFLPNRMESRLSPGYQAALPHTEFSPNNYPSAASLYQSINGFCVS